MGLISNKKLSEILGITPRYLSLLVKTKGFPREGRGRYDLVKGVQFFIRLKDEEIDRIRKGGDNQSQADLRLTLAKAELAEIEVARERADVISISDAVIGIQEALMVTRTGILQLSKKLSPILVNRSDPVEIENIIREQSEIALNELAEIPHRLNGTRKLPDARNSDGLEDIESPETPPPVAMGGRKSKPQSRKRLRAGAMDNRKGRISARDDGRGRGSSGRKDND